MTTPPSFPTRRGALVRNAIFAAFAIAWLVVMYVIDRQRSVQATTAPGRTPVVFSEAFEPNLLMDVTVRGPALSFEGEARRITRTPYEGRAVIQECASATGLFIGQRASLSFEVVSRWDNPGGFRTARIVLKPEITGILERPIRAKATRTGDYLMVNFETTDANTNSTKAVRIPEGADLSSGLMDSARVRPLFVGAKWQIQSVGLSGDVSLAEVEAVERTTIEIGGRSVPCFRALVRVEAATGFFKEFDMWFDLEGRALKQVIPAGPIEIVLTRRGRFVPTDDEFVLTDEDRARDE